MPEIHILSSDLLIADIIVPMNARLEALCAQHGLQPGGKLALSEAQFAEFSAALPKEQIILPGGSTANMLTTIGKLLGGEVVIEFLGVAGTGPYSAMIADSLRQAGVTLLPEHFDVQAQPGISYVMVQADGQRRIVTNPGNASAYLNADNITEEMIEKSDVVLLQGSLWYKFAPDFADKLLSLCLKFKKELWLALPTYSRFDHEVAVSFRDIMRQAKLVLGNEEELVRLYQAVPAEALKRLQGTLREDAAAFITQGAAGAALVTAKAMECISAPLSGHVVNTLGAGDTAFAGFASGYLKQLPLRICAELAMALAGEKLRVNNARLNDPRASLELAAPHLLQRLCER